MLEKGFGVVMFEDCLCNRMYLVVGELLGVLFLMGDIVFVC